MEFLAADLERAFSHCFLDEYRTILVGGGAEPLYLPSSVPEHHPHRIVYREDYYASALHEVSHWCLAGTARRGLEDYGYWYAPDGRDAERQAAFERVEARPQALEWILSETIGFDFQLSADNLEGGFGPSASFQAAVERERVRFRSHGLPPRAERFRTALGDLARGGDLRPGYSGEEAASGSSRTDCSSRGRNTIRITCR